MGAAGLELALGTQEVQGFVDDVRAGGYQGTLIVAEDLTTVRF